LGWRVEMKFIRILPAILLWTAVYYLAGVFITSEWDVSIWDGSAKFLTLLLVWTPGCCLIGEIYYENGRAK
jgi:membrane protein DedA with SNARE-associated domain